MLPMHAFNKQTAHCLLPATLDQGLPCLPLLSAAASLAALATAPAVLQPAALSAAQLWHAAHLLLLLFGWGCVGTC